jgi:hypothetical protein
MFSFETHQYLLLNLVATSYDHFDSYQATTTVKIKRLVTCRGKAIPLQAWRGPEGSRKLKLLDFKTIGI